MWYQKNPMVCGGCHDFPRVPGSITDDLISPLLKIS